MIGEIFYWVFNMSIAASVCGTAVILIRSFKRFPRRAAVLLWLIPFIRMCVPFGVAGEFGIFNLMSKLFSRPTAVYYADGSVITSVNFAMAAGDYSPFEYKTEFAKTVFSVGGAVWLTVALLLTAIFAAAYIITKRSVADARQLCGRIYVSDKIRIPAVYGVIRPKIVLPADMDKQHRIYAIRHESTHIRRGDSIIRLFAVAAVCIHWFNPLCLLFFKLYCTDAELACDESVLKSFSEDRRAEYALTLIDIGEKTSVIAPSMGGTKLRGRIENILTYKKLTVFASVCVSAFTVAIFYILLSNAK